MAKRLITLTKCPLCGDEVDPVSPAKLMKEPHYNNAELVITRSGMKQYIHSSCWYDMIKEKRPYDGRIYM